MKSVYICLLCFTLLVVFLQVHTSTEGFLNRKKMMKSTKRFLRKSKNNTNEYMSNIYKELIM